MRRDEFGLPDDAFVFCCFNNNAKITPDVFDVWMRLLRAVDSGVLWLLECSTVAAENLRREAEARGVSSRRLIFAPRIEVSEHLARQRCADLFLDTFYYDAHTTASDALWAGLPVLTCPGDSMAARVAREPAGGRRAAGVDRPRPATSTRRKPSSWHWIRPGLPRSAANLPQNRTTQPLFDTVRYARYLEQAYLQMHERHRAGLPPDHIVIAA